MKDRMITDSSCHNNQIIKMAQYASEIKRVFALDSLSSKINLYNLDCQLIK